MAGDPHFLKDNLKALTNGVSRGVLWVLKHPARADPDKRREKKKRRKEGKKRRKRRKERKQASRDIEKYLSPLPSLNGFQISRHGPIRRTPQQY